MHKKYVCICTKKFSYISNIILSNSKNINTQQWVNSFF